MPTIDVANQHMLSARAHGGDDMDWTALVGGQRIAAGLQPFVGRVCLSFCSLGLIRFSSLFSVFGVFSGLDDGREAVMPDARGTLSFLFMMKLTDVTMTWLGALTSGGVAASRGVIENGQWASGTC